MIAIGGGVALFGNATTLQGLGHDLTILAEVSQLRIKLIAVVGLMANALLKFVWSHRRFGHCAIMMAAVPNDPANPMARPRAAQAAEINITAVRSFNRAQNLPDVFMDRPVVINDKNLPNRVCVVERHGRLFCTCNRKFKCKRRAKARAFALG